VVGTKVATIECEPSASLVVVACAVPPATLAVDRTVVPSVKRTTPKADEGVTDAVSVTTEPALTLIGVTARVVVVACAGGAETTTVTTADVDDA
jgi:hypothetical protein